MKTAMEELREDLYETIIEGKESLKEIENEYLRETCVSIFEKTIQEIIFRIESELLEKEKQQIEYSFKEGIKYIQSV